MMPRGRLRPGSRISPAENVTPYQPSYVQSAAIMATAEAGERVGRQRPADHGRGGRGRHEPGHEEERDADDLEEREPVLDPGPFLDSELVHDRQDEDRAQAGELPAVEGPVPGTDGQGDEDVRGREERKKLPRYSPNPTERAAMPPLMITKKLAQP
jgi:hypothetical protein